jgi:hypothetical protein
LNNNSEEEALSELNKMKFHQISNSTLEKQIKGFIIKLIKIEKSLYK